MRVNGEKYILMNHKGGNLKAIPVLILLFMAGCVSSQKFRDQESQAQNEKKRADSLSMELEASRKLLEESQKEGAEFKGRLDAQETELASLKKSVKDLGDSLESNRGELSKKVSELVKEKDALMRRLTEAESAKKALEEAKAAELARLKENYESLTAGLKSEIASGEIKITELKGKLTVNMVDRILFDSGKDEIKSEGRKVLEKVGGVLEGVGGKDIRIEGHTDNKPIVGDLKKRFPSNWELSTARATAVARFLQDSAKLDPQRLQAAGYAEYRPVSPNNTPEERALNRRIEIILAPRE